MNDNNTKQFYQVASSREILMQYCAQMIASYKLKDVIELILFQNGKRKYTYPTRMVYTYIYMLYFLPVLCHLADKAICDKYM